MYGVVMTDEDLSSYELKRLERIKENRALLSQLFPEGTRLKSPRKKRPNINKAPPTDHPLMPLRRSKRIINRPVYYSPYDYGGPMTRSKAVKSDTSELIVRAKRRKKHQPYDTDHVDSNDESQTGDSDREEETFSSAAIEYDNSDCCIRENLLTRMESESEVNANNEVSTGEGQLTS